MRRPTTATYLIPAKHAADRYGSQPYVTRQTGDGGSSYFVTYPSAKNGTGNGWAVLASSLGSQPISCGVADPPSPSDVIWVVLCRDLLGNLVDSKFSNIWLQAGDPGHFGPLAYVFAGGATTGTYVPSFSNVNSTGQVNSVTRLGLGRYQVYLPNLGTLGGQPQVTGDNGYPCKIESWSPEISAASAQATPAGHGGEYVNIACRGYDGHRMDNMWWLTFIDGVTLHGESGRTGAYTWARERATVATARPAYHPQARYSYSSAGKRPTVTHTGVGTYTVKLPGMPTAGAAVITATGTSKVLCGLSAIRLDATPQILGVHCWKPSGAAADSDFTVAYVH